MATKELTQVFAEFDGENTEYRRRRSDSGLHRLAAVTTGTPLDESELIDGEVIIDLGSPKRDDAFFTPIASASVVASESGERAAARARDNFDARDAVPAAAEPVVQPRPSASRAAEVVRQIQARAAQPGAIEPVAAPVTPRRTVDMRGELDTRLPERASSPLAAAGPANAGGRTERYRAIGADDMQGSDTRRNDSAPSANRRRERDASEQRTPEVTKSNVSVVAAMQRLADPQPSADLELPAWPDDFDDLPGIERNTPIAGHIAVDDGADFEFVAESVAESLDAAFGEIAQSVSPGPIDQRADTKRNDKTPTERIETVPARTSTRRAQTLRMHTVPDEIRPSLRADTVTVEAETVSGEYAQAYEDEIGELERIDEVGSMVDPVFADLAEPEPAPFVGRAETPIRGLRAIVADVDDSSAETSEMVRVDERSYERHSAIEVDEVSAPRRQRVTSQLEPTPAVATEAAVSVPENVHGVSPIATLLALVIGPAVAAVVSFSLAAAPVLAWLGGTLGLFVSLFATGLAIRGRWDGAFINDCGHISASRLQLVVWTAILFPPLLVAVSWNALVATNAAALEISVPPTLWGLFAMAVASAVAAPMIRSDMQRRGVPLHRNTDNKAARWSDVFRRELSSVRDVVSVGKLQLLYVTGVLAAAYVTALYPAVAALEATSTPLAAFPAPSIGVLVLLILSHAAYLGDKVTDDAPSRVDASTTTIG